MSPVVLKLPLSRGSSAMNRIASIAVVIATILACQNANASLVGTTVDVDSSNFLFGSPQGVLVEAGIIELLAAGDTLDIEDSSIEFTVNGGGFEDPAFITVSNMTWGATPGAIVGINPIFNSLEPGTPLPDISFTADSVSIVFGTQPTFFQPGGSILVDLQVSHVPEPSSLLVWSLLGLAIGGFAWRRRNR